MSWLKDSGADLPVSKESALTQEASSMVTLAVILAEGFWKAGQRSADDVLEICPWCGPRGRILATCGGTARLGMPCVRKWDQPGRC